MHILLVILPTSRLPNDDTTGIACVGEIDSLALLINTDHGAPTQTTVKASLLLHFGLGLEETLDEGLADLLVLITIQLLLAVGDGGLECSISFLFVPAARFEARC